MAASAPTLTAKTNPVPGVEVYWSSLPAGTTAMTVYRLTDGVRSVVRNADAVTVSGSFAVVDYEAPLGASVTYSAETFISGVSDGISATASITIDSDVAWIQDPLDPNNSVSVSLGSGSNYMFGQNAFASIGRPTDVNKSKVLGRTRPVVQFYGRKGIEGLEVDVYVDNSMFGTFNDLLDVQPLLVRVPTRMPNLPRNLYVTISAVEEPVDWHSTDETNLTRFKLTMDEVEPQTLDITVNVFTYSRFEAKYATYTAAATVYNGQDYTYVQRNPLL